MTITTVLFGSIGSIAETSDIQRRAYNAAMAENGLPWKWDESTYRELLAMTGGQDRLRLLATATSTELDDDTIRKIHARKTEIACAEVVETGVSLRPGVPALIRQALDHGHQLGLVTTTYRPNIDAIATAAGDALPLERFGVVVTRDDVDAGKPAPDCYQLALERLGIGPEHAIAIEDTAASAAAAIGAGIRTIVTPGAMTDDQTIVGAELVLPALGSGDQIDPEVLDRLA